MSMDTVQKVIDSLRHSIGDTEKPYRFEDEFLRRLIDEVHVEVYAAKELLQKLDEITGDGTNRYDVSTTNLTYEPLDVLRVFIDTTEVPRIRRSSANVKT